MAAETSYGAAPAGGENLSFAEQLQKKHEQSHNPTIEEVEDEEDRLHPPPSSLAKEPTPAEPEQQPPVSEKARGKKKAEDTDENQDVQAEKPKAAPKAQVPNTMDEESFPALGSGPKPRTGGTAPAAAWGFQKPASLANNINGINGNKNVSIGPGSRSSTPNSQARIVTMPGRHKDSIAFAPSQMLPRTQLKKPINDLLRDINKRSKATIEMKQRHNENGTTSHVFEGSGPSLEVVREALQDIAKQVGAKVSIEVNVTRSMTDFWIGFMESPCSSQCKATHYWKARHNRQQYYSEEWRECKGAQTRRYWSPWRRGR